MFSLSRWSGGLVDHFGPKLPLTIGPFVAAVGFAMFAVPSVNPNYWTSFFPAVVVLGVGMAISVAPLTTTVMGSVDSEQAGTASGINNAVSRAAGLMAIAVFGVLMLHSFGNQLMERLQNLQINQAVRSTLEGEFVQLGGIKIPEGLDAATKEQLSAQIKGAFVSSFRLIMLVAAALSLGSALSSWFFIGKSPRKSGTTKTGKDAD
jgi:MFS family permease